MKSGIDLAEYTVNKIDFLPERRLRIIRSREGVSNLQLIFSIVQEMA